MRILKFEPWDTGALQYLPENGKQENPEKKNKPGHEFVTNTVTFAIECCDLFSPLLFRNKRVSSCHFAATFAKINKENTVQRNGSAIKICQTVTKFSHPVTKL